MSRTWIVCLALSAVAAFAAEGRFKKLPGRGNERIDFSTPMVDFSPSGENFRQNLKVVPNGDRGTAILTYTTLSGGLYAHYWTGEEFTPPVNLVPGEGKKTSVIGDRVVTCWISTDEHESEAAQARSGDALILFTAMDDDSDGIGPDGSNRVLWSAYFDEDNVGEETNWGFSAATRVSALDREEENVICHGIATDGLCGEARWLNFQHRYQVGEPTTGIVVFWTQAENVDSDPDVEDLATWYVHYDPAAALDSAIPLPASGPARLAPLGFGASDSGLTADQTRTEARYVSYNNVLVVRSAADPAGLGAEPDLWDYGTNMQNNDEITLQAFAFDLATGAVSPPTLLNTSAPVFGDNWESNAMPLRPDGSFLSGGRSMAGSDEGLGRLTFLFCELNNGQTFSTFGPITNNGRLTVAELNETTGALLESQRLDFEHADGFDSVLSTEVDFRLSRNGDYVWVAWLENSNAGLQVDKVLRARQVATIRADSVAPAAALASRTGPAHQVSAELDDWPVTWFTFRDGLGYVTGSQADANVLTIFYEQSCAIFDRVHYARMTADVTAPISTGATVGEVETFKEGHQPGLGKINTERYNFCGTDGGGGTSTIAFYVRDQAAEGATDLRLFSKRTASDSKDKATGTLQIDTTAASRQVPFQSLFLQGTSAGEAISSDSESSTRHHHFDIVHLFWTELKSTMTPAAGHELFTRRWHEGGEGGSKFQNHFTPHADKSPFKFSKTADSSEANDAEVWGIAVDGDRMGVWWTEGGHVWLQEFNHHGKGSHWLKSSADTSDPLVADDPTTAISRPKRLYFTPSGTKPGPTAPTVEDFRGFFTRSCTARTLQGAFIFWQKELGASGFPELQGRVRETEE